MNTTKLLAITAAALLTGGILFFNDTAREKISTTTNNAIFSIKTDQERSLDFYGEQDIFVPVGETHRINFPSNNPDGTSHIFLTAQKNGDLIMNVVDLEGKHLTHIWKKDGEQPDFSTVQIWKERNLFYVRTLRAVQTNEGTTLKLFSANKPELLPAAKFIEAQFERGSITHEQMQIASLRLFENNGLFPVDELNRERIVDILESF